MDQGGPEQSPPESSLDLFTLKAKFQIPPQESLTPIIAKYSLGSLNYFALTLKRSGDLILLRSEPWTMKLVPWFHDPEFKISALSFDEDGILYIGTANGTIYELNGPALFNSTETDLTEIFHFDELHITHILIWFKETTKTILCNGSNGKLLIISRGFPVLVSFSSPIISMDLFVNNIGCNCALVCLQCGTNLFTVLNDLKLQDDTVRPKSIFKRAKENFISKFSHEEKGLKSNLRAVVTGCESLSPNSTCVHVKFISLEDSHSEGLMRKADRLNQFIRHIGLKLDLFDSDFRQTMSVFIPSYVTRLYDVQRTYYGVDEENKCLRFMVIHNGALQEFATLHVASKILSIETVGESTPHSIFLVAEDGVYEVGLKIPPLDTCVSVLENTPTALDLVSTALGVPKSQVYSLSGDAKAKAGLYSRSIIFYKLAMLNHTKIMTKFGSRGHLAAMLCYFELAEREKSLGLSEKSLMANLALLARIEQFLRLGRDSKRLLEAMLQKNTYYSTKSIAISLCHPELVWALPIIRKARKCDTDILYGLCAANFEDNHALKVMLTSDWISIYTAPRPIFQCFYRKIKEHLGKIDTHTLHTLAKNLVPWRRDLAQKLFGEDPNEIIDFTGMTEGKVAVREYLELFMVVLLEILKRNDSNSTPCKLPVFPHKHNHSNGTDESSQRNTFAVSAQGCAIVRNGKVYCWGENRNGRLGIHESPFTFIQTPFQLNLPSSLRLSIDSISSGQAHTMALTRCGTLLMWGSNNYGQLGVGRSTMWTGYPTPLDIPVVFIAISAGSYHSVAMDSDHKVWIWGWGIFGQLGNGGIENVWKPKILKTEHKISQISAGHAHTGLLTSTGKALLFGCSHFGQLGHGYPNVKVKVPKIVEGFPTGLKLIECGSCSTLVVDSANKLYYCGLNPNSLKSLLSRSRHPRDGPSTDAKEEKDFYVPINIDTAHLSGNITKMRIGTTHFIILTSNGIAYTWGLGKSGQLIRAEEENKALEAIEVETILSDIGCSADCTFIIEKESGKLSGCGFNSCGQLGVMESGENSSILTIRTKKRVVKVRQPANIYARPREILGVPKELNQEEVVVHPVACPYEIVNQQMVEWCLKTWVAQYSPGAMINECLLAGNLSAAVVIETLIGDNEAALKHRLDLSKDHTNSSDLISEYAHKNKSTCLAQASQFVSIIVQHWVKLGFPGSALEDVLQKCRVEWPLLSGAVKVQFAEGDESARWMATNLTPVFILSCFNESRDIIPKKILDKEKDNNSNCKT